MLALGVAAVLVGPAAAAAAAAVLGCRLAGPQPALAAAAFAAAAALAVGRRALAALGPLEDCRALGSPRWATHLGTAWETAAVRQLVTGTAARATEAELGRTGSAAGTASAGRRTRHAQEDVRSAHNETASTHNNSVARATETVVRTASTCRCMLHGVVDGVAPAPVAPAAVVGGAAGGGYPQPTGCMGKRVTLKYPCSSSNTKRKMQ